MVDTFQMITQKYVFAVSSVHENGFFLYYFDWLY